jgi:hypothetical protein
MAAESPTVTNELRQELSDSTSDPDALLGGSLLADFRRLQPQPSLTASLSNLSSLLGTHVLQVEEALDTTRPASDRRLSDRHEARPTNFPVPV